MRVLLLDNGDPDIHRLIHLLHEQGADVVRRANDEIEIDDIQALAIDRIVISTGDDVPADAGITLPLVRELGIEYPMLGVGLGMLCMAVAYGTRVVPTAILPAALEHEGAKLLAGLPSPFALADDPALQYQFRLPPTSFWTMAWGEENEVLGIAHATLPLVGLLSLPAAPEHAHVVMKNFLALPPHEERMREIR